jgi:hypothetical protein
MFVWLVETFEPQARLTSCSLGYNIAQCMAGGTAPTIATAMVDSLGATSPGWYLTILAVISIVGLLLAPNLPPTDVEPSLERNNVSSPIENKEGTDEDEDEEENTWQSNMKTNADGDDLS